MIRHLQGIEWWLYFSSGLRKQKNIHKNKTNKTTTKNDENKSFLYFSPLLLLAADWSASICAASMGFNIDSKRSNATNTMRTNPPSLFSMSAPRGNSILSSLPSHCSTLASGNTSLPAMLRVSSTRTDNTISATKERKKKTKAYVSEIHMTHWIYGLSIYFPCPMYVCVLLQQIHVSCALRSSDMKFVHKTRRLGETFPICWL